MGCHRYAQVTVAWPDSKSKNDQMNQFAAILVVGTALLLSDPSVARAERMRVCKRACVVAVESCAAASTTGRPKSAVRRCRKELHRACKRGGTSACEPAITTTTTLVSPTSTTVASTTSTSSTSPSTSITSSTLASTTSSSLPPGTTTTTLPSFRGEYLLAGALVDTTCDLEELMYFDTGAIFLGVEIVNGARGNTLNGYYWGTDASGPRQAPPWWMKTGNTCLIETDDWCATGLLTVDGWPPASSSNPAPPATLVVTVEYWRTPGFPTCTITYGGEFRRAPE